MFYEHGVQNSPPAHTRWIHHWASHRLTAIAAPRGFAKSILLQERGLQDILTRPFYKVVGFYSILEKVQKAVSKLMIQIENNQLIIEDFGKLKPSRGSHGSWNKHFLQLTNGASIRGIPVRGASLGERPNRIYFDDPEDPRDHETDPTGSLEEFRDFVLSFVLPMATNKSVSVQFMNTNYTRRTFSYWLHSTDDPRIRQMWHCIKEKAYWTNQEGVREYLWPEGVTPEFLDDQLKSMGPALFSANYLNEPGTDSEKTLYTHPDLCTYSVKDADVEAYANPMCSSAKVETHQLTKWKNEAGGIQLPEYKKITRPWAEVVSGMQRFITVDWAETTTTMSDCSVVHVMGLENSQVHRDTLWSLDLWSGRVRLEELTRHIYRLARKWNVPWVGIEAFPVQSDYMERVAHDLPLLYGNAGTAPRVFPIKPPSKMKKPARIARMEWRFVQFRVKLPNDYTSRPDPIVRGAYTRLFDQLDNFTEDMTLLQHDDEIDTLSMHQWIGKVRTPPTAPDMARLGNPWELLTEGKVELEDGVPIMLGSLPLAHLTIEQLHTIRANRREELEEEYVEWSNILL